MNRDPVKGESLTRLERELSRVAGFSVSLHRKIAGDMVRGELRCEKCGAVEKLDLARVETYLRHGWPKHCGRTMGFYAEGELARERKQA